MKIDIFVFLYSLNEVIITLMKYLRNNIIDAQTVSLETVFRA